MKHMALCLLSLLAFLAASNAYSQNLIYKVNNPDYIPTGNHFVSAHDLYTQSRSKNTELSAGMQLITDEKVSLGFCSHTASQGEWPVKIVRQYSYRHPYSLGIIDVLKAKNPHIDNLNSMNAGEVIQVPVLFHSALRNNIAEDISCQTLLKEHLAEPFLLRGPEATYDASCGYFEPGISNSELLTGNEIKTPTLCPPEITTQTPVQVVEKTVVEKITTEEPVVEKPVQEETPSTPEEQPVTEDSDTNNTTEQSSNAHNELIFRLGGSFDSIHSNKNKDKTVLISDLQPTLSIEWKRHFGDNWRAFLGLGAVWHKYQDTDTAGKVFDKREINAGALYAGGEYAWGILSSATLSAGTREALYYQQTSEDVYQIKKDNAPYVQLQVAQRLYGAGTFAIGASILARSTGEGSEDYKGGTDYGLGLTMKKSAWSATVLSRQGDFESSWSEFSHRWLDFTLGYHLNF